MRAAQCTQYSTVQVCSFNDSGIEMLKAGRMLSWLARELVGHVPNCSREIYPTLFRLPSSLHTSHEFNSQHRSIDLRSNTTGALFITLDCYEFTRDGVHSWKILLLKVKNRLYKITRLQIDIQYM